MKEWWECLSPNSLAWVGIPDLLSFVGKVYWIPNIQKFVLYAAKDKFENFAFLAAYFCIGWSSLGNISRGRAQEEQTHCPTVLSLSINTRKTTDSAFVCLVLTLMLLLQQGSLHLNTIIFIFVLVLKCMLWN